MSLGSVIAQTRAQARLTIEELSKSTNIPAVLLRDMENDNFKKCGGQTYARGHLRNIAAKLGVDERIFLDLFEIEVTAPAKPIRELLSTSNVTAPYKEPHNISWKVLAGGSLAALLLFGVVQIVLSNMGGTTEIPIVASSPSATSIPTSEQTPATEPTQSSAVAGKVTVEVIAVRATSWLFVTNDKGDAIFSGQLRKGERRIFSDNNQLNLRVGNAGGVDLKVNGEQVAPIGANKEVINLTYNAD